jgi:serine/threonine protein kinase
MVKVFLKADVLIQQRYEALYRYLHGEAPDFRKISEHFVDFTFYPDSVRVGANKYYSLVRMEKKKLKTLFETVEECRTDKARMNALISKFTSMMATIQNAGIVHGDIEPSNILVDKDKLILIDYDLTTTPLSRPLASILLGKRHYRHPKVRQGGPEVTDDFAAWIMYYSLRLLTLYPTFWNEAGAKPGRLLFHADDLYRPSASTLFSMLRSHFNDEVRSIAGKVIELCKTPPEQIPPFRPFAPAQMLDSMLTQIGSQIQSGSAGFNANLPAVPTELGGAPLVVALIPAVLATCIAGAVFGIPAAMVLFPFVLVAAYMALRRGQP